MKAPSALCYLDAELLPTGPRYKKKVRYINKGRQIIRVSQGGRARRMKKVRRALLTDVFLTGKKKPFFFHFPYPIMRGRLSSVCLSATLVPFEQIAFLWTLFRLYNFFTFRCQLPVTKICQLCCITVSEIYDFLRCTVARHWPISWVSWIDPDSPRFFKSYFNIILPSAVWFPKSSSTLVFAGYKCMYLNSQRTACSV